MSHWKLLGWLIAIVVALAGADTARAQGYSEVTVVNRCDREIRVAAHYMDNNVWQTDWWWHLSPGESAYILDTEARYTYFYAETTSGPQVTWGQACDTRQTVAGRSLCMFEADTGTTTDPYTQPFTCTSSAASPLSYGARINDTVNSSAGDRWSFSGAAGDGVSITMGRRNGSGLDTTLELLRPDGSRLAFDDDGGTDTDSAITVSLPVSGTYTIVARGYGGATGAYWLSLARNNTASASGHIRYGARLSDNVTSAAGDRWTFDGSSGHWVEITMSSAAMDTYLILLGPDGSTVASDDDGGPGTNSRIYVRSLPRTGRYTIVAKGYNGATGSYSLTLD